MDLRNNNALNLAKGGMLTALGVIFVYLSSIVPVNKLFLLGIASSLIPLSVITTSIKNSIIVYLATSVICIFISSSKIVAIFYIAFFGLYGIVKYYIERIRIVYLEYILKLAFFNSVMFALFYTYQSFIPSIINLDKPLFLLLAGSEVGFLIYDYALTLFIDYISRIVIKKRNS